MARGNGESGGMWQTPDRGRGLFSNLARGFGRTLTGGDDERLTPEQDRQARKDALIQAGLSTILQSQAPGATALGSLAAGAMAGREQFAGAGDRQMQLEQEAVGRQQQQQMLDYKDRLQGLVQSGQVGMPQLQQMFSEALANGDENAYRALAEVIKSMQTPTADSAAYMVRDKGLNPETGKLEYFYTDRRDPTKPPVWTGVEPPPPTPGVQFSLDNSVKKGQLERVSNKIDTAWKDIDAGYKLVNNLNLMDTLLDTGTETGIFEEATLKWRTLGVMLGVADATQVASQELFNGLAQKLALGFKAGEGENGALTGQMSDRDIIFLQQQGPRLANSVEGNRLLIAMHRAVAERKVAEGEWTAAYFARDPEGVNFIPARKKWVAENQVDWRPIIAEMKLRVAMEEKAEAAAAAAAAREPN